MHFANNYNNYIMAFNAKIFFMILWRFNLKKLEICHKDPYFCHLWTAHTNSSIRLFLPRARRHVLQLCNIHNTCITSVNKVRSKHGRTFLPLSLTAVIEFLLTAVNDNAKNVRPCIDLTLFTDVIHVDMMQKSLI